MRNNILAGIGLGLVAAIAFASATTGPFFIRLILFFITPLPVALAGLGWSPRAAIAAGAAGTFVVGLWAGGVAALAFALSQAVPVVVLTYLALLARPSSSGDGSAPSLEWYPPGRLIIWSAMMAGALATLSLLALGGDIQTLKDALAKFFETAAKEGLETMPGGTPLGEAEIKSLSEVALGILPAASATSWMASLLFNLWLAGRITLASGQLVRPWPDLAAIEFPRGTALAFAAALLATTLGGYVGLAASGFAGGLFVAFVLLGLAVIHYTTRGQPWRPFALWGLYMALFIINIWIGVLVALVGLAEPMVHMRARHRPPANPST